MHNLGVMYVQGAGVDPDVIEAYMWFDIATTLGYEDAAPARQTVAYILTRDVIDKAESRSLAWLRNKDYAS